LNNWKMTDDFFG